MPTKKVAKKVMPRAVTGVKEEETPTEKRKRLAEEKKAKSRR
jgi:hypothetical protein